MLFEKRFFSPQDETIIINAIQEAEKSTSGELRVHVEKNCKGDPFERALAVFHKLNMQTTRQQNAVLFYISYGSKKLAIVAGKGINEVVPPGFWDTIRDQLIQEFKKGNTAIGLASAITQCGLKLQQFFPWQSDDTNELPNTISYKA